MGELQDQMDHAQEQLRQVESDLEEVQGERAAKLKELKQKEQQRKGEYSNTDRFPVILSSWQGPLAFLYTLHIQHLSYRVPGHF